MRGRFASVLALLLVTAGLASCAKEPRGKKYFAAHPDELSQVVKACADGTHPSSQECSNAADVYTLRKARESLSR